MGHMPERVLNLSESHLILQMFVFKGTQFIYHCFLQSLKKKEKKTETRAVLLSKFHQLCFKSFSCARLQCKCSFSPPDTNKAIMEILNLFFKCLCSISAPPFVLKIQVFCGEFFFPVPFYFFCLQL
jgi:hypothetical protein